MKKKSRAKTLNPEDLAPRASLFECACGRLIANPRDKDGWAVKCACGLNAWRPVSKLARRMTTADHPLCKLCGNAWIRPTFEENWCGQFKWAGHVLPGGQGWCGVFVPHLPSVNNAIAAAGFSQPDPKRKGDVFGVTSAAKELRKRQIDYLSDTISAAREVLREVNAGITRRVPAMLGRLSSTLNWLKDA